MSENVKKIASNAAAIHLGGKVYTVALNRNRDDAWHSTNLFDYKNDWERDPTYVMGKKIVPYGRNNDLPTVIRKLMDENSLAPGIIERQIGLLYGNGPALFRYAISESGRIERRYERHPEVEKWLKSWDVRKYIEMAMVEYKHTKGIFVRHYRNRGARIGSKSYVAKLQVVSATDARLGWPDTADQRLEDVDVIYTGDFENNCLRTGITAYPVYSNNNPLQHRVAMSYHNSYTFGRNFYPVPAFFGAFAWITRSSEIPEILNYLTENGITAAYHIQSPAGYWEDKKNKLRGKFPDKPDTYIDSKLEELKDQLFESISTALAGKKNVGKFIETLSFYDDNQNLCEWKIEPIKQEIKEFIEAQIKVAEKADSATTSSMGLHPSLTNLIVGGKLASGSELLYALKAHMLSDVNIPEEIIFEAINQTIAVNFPGTDLRLGFYRDILQAEDNVPASDRIKNNV